MRWFWVDRFTEFVSGSHACGMKNITLAEEVVDKYCPGFPMLPPTLIIEGMAQLGGILVAEHFGFEKRVVLAKIGKARFLAPARTGQQLHYRVQADAIGDQGATVNCVGHCGDTPQSEVELMFAFLGQEDQRFPSGPLFEDGDLESMLRMMHFFHVAVDSEGRPVPIYENL